MKPNISNSNNSKSKMPGKGKVRFAPTRYGWLFVIVLLGMLLGSVNYNNNLGFLFTFLLGSMALVSLIYTFRNLTGIQIESVQTWPVFASEKATFDIGIHPVKSFRRAIRLELQGGEDTIVDMESGVKGRFTVFISTVKRGRLSPGKVAISTDYPFGLFRFTIKFPITTDCLVYPKPIPARLLTVQDLLAAHSEEGNRLASADDFKGLRMFQNGDPIQRIFWKAFSKGQGLVIKEFVGSESPAIFFSWRRIKAEDIEKKLAILCAMILRAHGMKLSFGLKIPGKIIAPDSGESHKHNCLRALALF